MQKLTNNKMITEKACNHVLLNLDVETKRILVNIILELEKAEEKHPAWPSDHIHASAVVAEESGELVRAALQYKYEKGRYYDMHKEAIQTGAMAIRFLKNAQEF